MFLVGSGVPPRHHLGIVRCRSLRINGSFVGGAQWRPRARLVGRSRILFILLLISGLVWPAGLPFFLGLGLALPLLASLLVSPASPLWIVGLSTLAARILSGTLA